MSNLTRKIKKVIADPGIIPFIFIPKRLLPDRNFLRYKYCKMTGLKLNLKNPVLFNEKLQWLKLNDRHAGYSALADKYEVRKYVAQTIGDEYLVPIYGVWDKFEDIPFDTLPDQFVLKCTHDSGSIVICKDKKTINMKKTREHFKKHLSKNYYWTSREWVYKNIKPRIIAEKLMIDERGGVKDYKIFCFDGEPKIIEVDVDMFTAQKMSFYSPQWEYHNLTNNHLPNAIKGALQKPESLELMLELAKKLSASKIHLRVDLYNVNNKIYFGELTFNDGGGFNTYDPPEWNRTFGDWLTLKI